MTWQCICFKTALKLVHHSPSPLATSLFSTSVSLFLPCKQVHQYHFIVSYICTLIYNICFGRCTLDPCPAGCTLPSTASEAPGPCRPSSPVLASRQSAGATPLFLFPPTRQGSSPYGLGMCVPSPLHPLHVTFSRVSLQHHSSVSPSPRLTCSLFLWLQPVLPIMTVLYLLLDYLLPLPQCSPSSSSFSLDRY